MTSEEAKNAALAMEPKKIGVRLYDMGRGNITALCLHETIPKEWKLISDLIFIEVKA